LIIERDLEGWFMWVVVDDELTIVDPKFIREFADYFFS